MQLCEGQSVHVFSVDGNDVITVIDPEEKKILCHTLPPPGLTCEQAVQWFLEAASAGAPPLDAVPATKPGHFKLVGQMY